ncbi:SAM-dependent DNA methyltransferase [Polaribacter aestuariivivens]|uniref:site-specific DNA-methyltransferase (adenine-specific) n=1 Tax=Polaribacter aestuariivivens TaxID=2304626 RepID=A0A5S3N5B9_9FLAO|nr:class I SAM-dependent DNA methyltransferase [Polaribacter aestuariivivens]TMM30453.1 SAM-dependent DNA methyltransferase [Polaribacter aestuariivivens]
MITKQALGSTLFGMADILRDKVEDYKAYILSLLFFKRLSDNYEWETENEIKEFVKREGRQPTEAEKRIIVAQKHDFKIPEGCFWKDVRDASPDKKNEKLNKAVNEIADANVDRQGKAVLKGVINTVRWNEPAPDGSGSKKLSPQVLTSLVSYLDAVDLSNKNASVDVLGDAYEYLIKRFADENKGGTTAGQFYTPQEVVDVIVRYLKPQKNTTVYDPTCGSGGFLINAAKYCKTNYNNSKAIRLFGQEDVWNTWAIANINMILHGLDARIEKGDTILDPKFVEEDNELEIKQFDLAMANFPFSQENWWKNGEPKRDKKGKVVNKKDGSPQLVYPKDGMNDPYGRLIYGQPPFSNGDFAFLQHIVASIKDDGKAGVVCPQGVLFRGQPEKTEEEDGQNRKADDEYLIRRGFLQGKVDHNGEFAEMHNIIDAIVVLPGNLFYGTTIPGAILFINKNKPEERKDKVLMVYAAKEGWYKEEPNMNVLLPHDILRISTILESWGDLETAKTWIDSQKTRLKFIIQEDLDFKLSEIDEYYKEDIETAEAKLLKAKKVITAREAANKKPTKGQEKAVVTAQTALDKLTTEKDNKINAVHEQAEKERHAIDDVEQELITMLQDPELRKRYFSIADMEELEENEFNLNIPRYVDTFEPEEEIDLKEAITEFQATIDKENDLDKSINELLKVLV